MAAYITVLNYLYSLCVFYYSVLSCVADVADCPLQRLSAIVINNIIIIIIIIIITSRTLAYMLRENSFGWNSMWCCTEECDHHA